jgi:DnaJ like chaperone protein
LSDDQRAFEILGLEPNADKAEIKKAYLRKIKQNHPDLVSNMGIEIKGLAEKMTKDANWAYERLVKKAS